MEAIGFLSYYGFSPPIDILWKSDVQDDKEINILISDSGDIRHVLKTLSDNCSSDLNWKEKVNVRNFKFRFSFMKKQKKI